ncbi:hypothetical protein BDZ97DRAFT_1767877 [Flammula alnicola]|nr:hypothetical protein BDZ97DRAFT_1767877 [Flammula alnicola]
MEDDIALFKNTDTTAFFEFYALHAATSFPTLLSPQSTLPNGRLKILLLTLQADLKIKEGIIIYDCCLDFLYHLERPQFRDDLEGGAYTVNDIISLHSFLCDEVKETMMSMLLGGTYWGPWKTSTIVLTKSSSSPAFHHFWKEHASSPVATSLGGIGSLVSDPSLDSSDWDFSLSAMYLDPVAKFFLIQLRNYAQELWEAFLITVHLATTKTAIAVVNALDIKVVMFSMWHAKQGKFDISRDCICLAAMLMSQWLEIKQLRSFSQCSNANLALTDVQKAVAYMFGHTLYDLSGMLSSSAVLHSTNGAWLDVLLCEEDTQAEAAAGAGLGEQH